MQPQLLFLTQERKLLLGCFGDLANTIGDHHEVSIVKLRLMLNDVHASAQRGVEVRAAAEGKLRKAVEAIPVGALVG